MKVPFMLFHVYNNKRSKIFSENLSVLTKDDWISLEVTLKVRFNGRSLTTRRNEIIIQKRKNE